MLPTIMKICKLTEAIANLVLSGSVNYELRTCQIDLSVNFTYAGSSPMS